MYACIYIMCFIYSLFWKKAGEKKKHEEHITYGIPYRLSWCLPFPACNFLNFTSSPQFQYTRHFNQICKLAFPVSSCAAPAPINLFSYMTRPIWFEEKLIITMPRASSWIINNVLNVMWLSAKLRSDAKSNQIKLYSNILIKFYGVSIRDVSESKNQWVVCRQLMKQKV